METICKKKGEGRRASVFRKNINVKNGGSFPDAVTILTKHLTNILVISIKAQNLVFKEKEFVSYSSFILLTNEPYFHTLHKAINMKQEKKREF